MTSQKFDIQLKNDYVSNNFRIEGQYVVFDKTANLEYQITPNFTLGELLTKNQVNTYTKLHKSLLIKLQRIREAFGSRIKINSSYRDFYYNKASGGASSSEHLKGNAIDIAPFDKNEVDKLHSVALADYNSQGGGIGLYDTFLHIDTGDKRIWDEQGKKWSGEDGLLILDSDEKKNYALLALLTLVALFLFKR